MTSSPVLWTRRERVTGEASWYAEYFGRPLEDYEPQFEDYLGRLGPFVEFRPGLRVLEVGSGSGWFLVLCRQRGFNCDGVEHNPRMVEGARELARCHGLELTIYEDSIETVKLPSEEYDLVVAMSVLEHVENYQRALSVIQRTLRPGGVFWGASTNKFSLRSGEYPRVPLYGWLPYSLRRAIRVHDQGPEIVSSSGIDFNQFTYFGIRRALRRAGFTQVYDRFELLRPEKIVRRHLGRVVAAHLLHRVPALRTLPRVFDRGTSWVAVK